MSSKKPEKEVRFVTIFDDTYNQPDCRAYYHMLRAFGYTNHYHAVPVFRAVLTELCRVRGLSSANVFDFASSYGIVSALMKHDITTTAFLDRYESDALDDFSAQEMLDQDRSWLATTGLRTPPARYSGLDVAQNAVAYGKSIGVFDQAFAEDLQANDPSDELRTCLAATDLIVECGSVAHLMPAVLDRLLDASSDKQPWVVTSPVRGNERQAAFEVMQDHGLVVETLGLPPFPHRRFEDADEQARATEHAHKAGHDTGVYESSGSFFAQIYLGRPKGETTPVSEWNVQPPNRTAL